LESRIMPEVIIKGGLWEKLVKIARLRKKKPD
jgi:hypothetical protein